MSDEHGTPRPEPGIGRGLQRAREDKGLTLGQAEQETKIRARYLQAFERGNFDVLPAVYVLGSLKTYADFLGLDGAALSGELKATLAQPAEPDLPAQLAGLEESRDEDGEYEAAPVAAVGFDQLFLGMGVLLISILAVMTLVTSLAQGDESPISQLNEPSIPETPSEMALAANVEDEPGPRPQRPDGPSPAKGDGGGEDKREDPSGDKLEESKNGKDGKDQDDSRGGSLFGDAKFVPMTPASPTAAASAPTSASATAQPNEPSAPASTAASSPKPYEGLQDPVSAPPAAAAGDPNPLTEPGGGEGRTPAPAGADDQDPISAQIDRKVDGALEAAGLGG
jgi:cytoskeletal protein RodZ